MTTKIKTKDSNSNVEIVPKSSDSEDDEVNLLDIVRPLWEQRRKVLLAMLLAVIAAFSYVGYNFFAKNPVEYYISLQNIKNEAYPNESAFSPNDLLSSAVLNEIDAKYGLGGESNLTRAVTINYESPVSDGLMQAYKARLAAKNISPAELTTINANYLSEVKSYTSNSLLITVNPEVLGVSNAVAKDIARDIPLFWTKIYSRKFNVFQNKGIAAVQPIKMTALTSEFALSLKDNVVQMLSGLEEMAEDPRLQSLKSGNLSLSELLFQVRNFNDIYLTPVILHYYSQNGDPYVNAYQRQLQLKLEDAQRQVLALDRAISSLRDNNANRAGNNTPANNSQTAESKIDLGSGNLQAIVELADKANASAYLQELITKRIKLEEAASKIEREYSLVKGAADQSSSMEKIYADIKHIYPEIERSYNIMIKASNERLASSNATFYAPTLGPTAVGNKLLSAQNLAAIVLALVLGFILSALGVYGNMLFRKLRTN